MVLGAILLLASQGKHSRASSVTPYSTEYFSRKWHARDWTTGKSYRVVSEDFATAANVLSANGTYAEGDDLARAFRPFWVETTKDGQRVDFERELTVPGELQSCSAILSVDDDYVVQVNDKEIAGGHDLSFVNREFSLLGQIHIDAANKIEVIARNRIGPAFVRCRLDVETSLPVRGNASAWTSRPTGANSFSRAAIVHSTVFDSRKGDCIWSNANPIGVQCAEFRRVVDIDGVPGKCSILIGADNAWDLSVNGAPVARQGMTMDPAAPRVLDVSAAMKPGPNVIQIKVWNYGGPGALFCVPTIRYAT